MDQESELKNINSKNINKLSETAIIAIAPALAYYSAFIYEKAYFGAFNLPVDMIRVELTTTLAFAAALIGILITIIMLINPLFTMVGAEEDRKGKPFRRLIWIYMPLIIYALAYMYIYDFKMNGIIMFGSLLFLMFLVHIFPALIFTDKAPTFIERLDIGMSSGHGGQTVFSVIRSYFGKYGVYIILLVVFSINLASAMGRSDAMKKNSFYVPYSNPDLLVAKMYSDKAICISIDNVTGVIKDGFTIINLNQDNMIRFKLSKVPSIKIN